MALFEGLVTYDNQTAEARSGLAESWKIAKDLVTYTFKLRKAVWSDGIPINSKTVVDSWLRELDPQTGAPGGDAVADLVAGGRDYRSGQAGPEAVQIKAVDESTFQVRFTSPLPTLSRLADCAFAVVPVHAIAQFGPAWTRPENFVGNGAYRLERWVPHTGLTVVPNRKYWDQRSVRLARITFLPLENNAAGYRLYKRGEADWMTSVPLDEIDEARARKDFHNEMNLGTYFYRLNVTDPALQDARVRRALALAVDRTVLVKRVLPGSLVPAYSFTPPLSSYTPPVFAAKDDSETARQLLAEAGFPGGQNLPPLTILFNTGETNRKVGEFFQEQWKRNLGLDVELKSEDWKTYQADMKALNFQMARSAWIGDYNDPMTFLDMYVTGGADNNTGFSNPRYDALVAEAKALPAGPGRMKVLKELETLLMAQLPIIPIYTYTSPNLIDLTRWSGWFPNILDVHPWKNVGRKK